MCYINSDIFLSLSADYFFQIMLYCTTSLLLFVFGILLSCLKAIRVGTRLERGITNVNRTLDFHFSGGNTMGRTAHTHAASVLASLNEQSETIPKTKAKAKTASTPQRGSFSPTPRVLFGRHFRNRSLPFELPTGAVEMDTMSSGGNRETPDMSPINARNTSSVTD